MSDSANALFCRYCNMLCSSILLYYYIIILLYSTRLLELFVISHCTDRSLTDRATNRFVSVEIITFSVVYEHCRGHTLYSSPIPRCHDTMRRRYSNYMRTAISATIQTVIIIIIIITDIITIIIIIVVVVVVVRTRRHECFVECHCRSE